MKFAFAGFDSWHTVFDAFVAAGWKPVALYSFPVDDELDFNKDMIARAEHRGIPVKLSRIREDDLRWLAEQRCDALVVAGYPWRIPEWNTYLRYAVNFHPAPLPEGRGPYPMLQAIAESRREWGVSCHQIDANFDTGDVLASEIFPLDADEWHETLQLKMQMAAKRLARNVATRFDELWGRRRQQGDGSYWPRLPDADRTLDFTRPVAELMRIVRVHSFLECIAPLYGKLIYVRRAMAWREEHYYKPGQVVHEYHRSIVVAAADGFVALIEWSPLSRFAPHSAALRL